VRLGGVSPKTPVVAAAFDIVACLGSLVLVIAAMLVELSFPSQPTSVSVRV
jgi:hypothetical protein